MQCAQAALVPHSLPGASCVLVPFPRCAQRHIHTWFAPFCMTRVQHTCHAIWVPLRLGLLHPGASTPSRPAGPTCSASTRSPCPKGLIAFGSMFWLLHVRYPLRPSDRLQCVLAPNGRSERYSQYALLSAITPLKHGLLMYVTHVRLIIGTAGLFSCVNHSCKSYRDISPDRGYRHNRHQFLRA